MKTALVAGDMEVGPDVAGALASLGLSVRTCELDEVVEEVRTSPPVLLVVGPSDASTPDRIAAIGRELKNARPPVLAVLAEGDAALRDRLVLAGASAVCWGREPSSLVEAAAPLARWVRGQPLRPLKISLKARRARERLEVPAKDVDPSGLALASAEGLVRGELLQLLLPLPGEPMAVWGRVVAHEGGPAIRFVGLSPDERDRLIVSLGGQPPTRPIPAAEPAADVAPPSEPEAVDAEGAEPPPADDAMDASPEAGLASDGQVPVSDETPAVSPDEADAGVTDIAAAIGEVLGDEGREEASAKPESAPPLETIAWPSVAYDPVTTLGVLEEGFTSGQWRDEPGAPPPEALAGFANTLVPVERRLFSEGPPPEQPGVELDKSCLGLRARLFAVILEGEQIHNDPQLRAEIDADAIAALASEVNQSLDGYQKLIDGLFSGNQVAEVKELGRSRAALGRALADVRRLERVLRGEDQGGYVNLALLDVAEQVGAVPSLRRSRAGAKDKDAGGPQKKAAVSFVPKEMSAAKKRYLRLAVMLLLLVAVSVAAVMTRPDPPQRWTPDQVREFPGVLAAEIRKDRKGNPTATVTVNEMWEAEPEQVRSLQSRLSQHGARQVIVVDTRGKIRALVNDKAKVTVVGKE